MVNKQMAKLKWSDLGLKGSYRWHIVDQHPSRCINQASPFTKEIDINFERLSHMIHTSVFAIQQTTVSKSTIESEYQCASHAAQTFEGYINLFGKLGNLLDTPTRMLIDNMSTIGAFQTQATSFKLRHLLIDHNSLRELFFRGMITPQHMNGKRNRANLGTKCLTANATEHYSRYILDWLEVSIFIYIRIDGFTKSE